MGFDTEGANAVVIKGARTYQKVNHRIDNSREGWVESLRVLLTSHFEGTPRPIFDFQSIRPKGSLIKGFGGYAAGPEPLRRMLEDIHELLASQKGRLMTSTVIVDIMNLIGRCVVSGGAYWM